MDDYERPDEAGLGQVEDDDSIFVRQENESNSPENSVSPEGSDDSVSPPVQPPAFQGPAIDTNGAVTDLSAPVEVHNVVDEGSSLKDDDGGSASPNAFQGPVIDTSKASTDLSALAEANNAMDKRNIPEHNDTGSASPPVSHDPGIDTNEAAGNLGAPNEANNAMDEGNVSEHNDDGDHDQQEADHDQHASQESHDPTAILRKRIKVLQARLDGKEHTIEARDKLIEVLKNKIRSLRQKLRNSRGNTGHTAGQRQARQRPNGTARSKVYTWQAPLRRLLAGDTGVTWTEVWKQTQKELNMPVKPEIVHPNVRLIAREANDSPDSDYRDSSPVVPAVLPQKKKFRLSFDDLPAEVLFNILEELLWFDESLIHCFSRFDPYVAPDHFPSEQELGERRSTGVKGRFFISAEKRALISLTFDTVDPNKVLAPLAVCRRWAWYGIHIFYGRNTFAFSSLGEVRQNLRSHIITLPELTVFVDGSLLQWNWACTCQSAPGKSPCISIEDQLLTSKCRT